MLVDGAGGEMADLSLEGRHGVQGVAKQRHPAGPRQPRCRSPTTATAVTAVTTATLLLAPRALGLARRGIPRALASRRRHPQRLAVVRRVARDVLGPPVPTRAARLREGLVQALLQ